MTKTIFSKVVWFGRATTFLVGLAVILALTVGLVSTALAGTGVGAAFNLGKANSVNALSTLVGSTSSSMLKVDNNGAGTALDLKVGPSTTPPDQKATAPMKVDSQVQVTNLNADKLDGMDAEQLQGFSTLRVSTNNVSHTPGTYTETASCQAGEQAISGSVELLNGDAGEIIYFAPGGIPVVDSTTGKITGWRASYISSFNTVVRVYAVCAS